MKIHTVLWWEFNIMDLVTSFWNLHNVTQITLIKYGCFEWVSDTGIWFVLCTMRMKLSWISRILHYVSAVRIQLLPYTHQCKRMDISDFIKLMSVYSIFQPHIFLFSFFLLHDGQFSLYTMIKFTHMPWTNFLDQIISI